MKRVASTKATSHHVVRSTNKATLKDIGGYEKVLDTFRRYDADHNGVMSYGELHKLMRDLNHGKWTEAESDRLLLAIDKNRNGTIDINEFVSYVFDNAQEDANCAPRGMSDYERVLQQFRQFDINRNGTLDRAEFTRLMQMLQPGRWLPEHTDSVFAAVDLNNSGEVDLDELVAYLFGVKQELPRHAKNGASGPYIIVEFTIGPGRPEIFVQQLANYWRKQFGEDVAVSRVLKRDVNGIIKVSAQGGDIVFWDDASMLPYRGNPFLTLESLKVWRDEMTRRHLPALLQGARAGSRAASKTKC
mmetsp:Transcript_73810/g.161486  ORF Transcript_73810/g.161486 Transcript_73810/m.161486 type:complete len:302 (+) Transcript_73810:391-1296(+)